MPGARVAPTREGYVNAIQVWPYTDGALYQVYAAVGRVTVIALQPGEELVTVAAGDTVRWIVGDTSSGNGAELRVNVLVKPIRSGWSSRSARASRPISSSPPVAGRTCWS